MTFGFSLTFGYLDWAVYVCCQAGNDKVMPHSTNSLSAQETALPQENIHIDLPIWMIHQLNAEAYRTAIAPEDVIKIWLAERLSVEQRNLQARTATL